MAQCWVFVAGELYHKDMVAVEEKRSDGEERDAGGFLVRHAEATPGVLAEECAND